MASDPELNVLDSQRPLPCRLREVTDHLIDDRDSIGKVVRAAERGNLLMPLSTTDHATAIIAQLQNAIQAKERELLEMRDTLAALQRTPNI